MAEARTELSSLGEFGLIDHLTEKARSTNEHTLKGIGDDAAVIHGGEEAILISTDMLMEGVHFDLSYTPLKHLGYKAVMVNLSDIYAMNARPEQITVSLALSNRFSLEAVEELYAGVHLACKLYDIDLIGGDTTSSMSGLGISVTAIGRQQEEKIAYRKGAQENDLIVVSGDLGAAYMGLQVLEREKAVFQAAPDAQPELGGNDYILERCLKPEARRDVIELFKELDLVPTSMIDISDGLASEVKHLAKSSKKGMVIYEEKIPLDETTIMRAEDFDLNVSTCALNGGEDYELLMTISQSDYEKIKGSPLLTVIGHVADEAVGCQMITRDGEQIELQAQGWDHMNSQD